MNIASVYFVWKRETEEPYICFDEYGVGRYEFRVAGGIIVWDGYCSDVFCYINKRRGVKHD